MDNDFNVAPTFWAILPLTPVSISSKIKRGSLSFFAKTDLSANIILETSPPDATLANGFASSPKLVEIKNSTSSKPFELNLYFVPSTKI